MTLLITLAAAVISTVLWYTRPNSKLKLGKLSLMYWGASLMWSVDAVAEYIEQKERFFAPKPYDMLNDGFLGLSVVVFALMVWLAMLLITDPCGRVKAALSKAAANKK